MEQIVTAGMINVESRTGETRDASFSPGWSPLTDVLSGSAEPHFLLAGLLWQMCSQGLHTAAIFSWLVSSDRCALRVCRASFPPGWSPLTDVLSGSANSSHFLLASLLWQMCSQGLQTAAIFSWLVSSDRCALRVCKQQPFSPGWSPLTDVLSGSANSSHFLLASLLWQMCSQGLQTAAISSWLVSSDRCALRVCKQQPFSPERCKNMRSHETNEQAELRRCHLCVMNHFCRWIYGSLYLNWTQQSLIKQ